MSVNSYKHHLVVIAQRLQVSDQFVWFHSRSLTICAATHASLRLLGADGDRMAEGKVNMTSHFDEAEIRKMVACPYTTGETPWSKHHSHTLDVINVGRDYHTPTEGGTGSGSWFDASLATRNGDCETLASLLREGLDVDHSDADGQCVAVPLVAVVDSFVGVHVCAPVLACVLAYLPAVQNPAAPSRTL